MLSKIAKNLFAFSLLIALLTACNKDEITPNVNGNTDRNVNFFQMANTNNSSNSDTTDIDCFEFVFPISISLPDGSSQSFDSEEALEDFIDQWFEANPDAEDFPEITYPITVTLESGEQLQINDEETLCELFEDCFEDEWEDGEWEDEEWEDYEDCYEIVFPVDVELPGDSVVTANNEEELFEILDAWWEECDEDTEDYPDFVYPIEVILDDSTTVTVNDVEELDDLDEECYGDDFEDCFTFNFPLQFTLPDGTTITANSEDEAEDAIDNWYEQNPDSEEEPELVYPISVTLDDGTVQDVNNDDELEVLFEECYGEFAGDVEGLVTAGSKAAVIELKVKADKN